MDDRVGGVDYSRDFCGDKPRRAGEAKRVGSGNCSRPDLGGRRLVRLRTIDAGHFRDLETMAVGQAAPGQPHAFSSRYVACVLRGVGDVRQAPPIHSEPRL